MTIDNAWTMIQNKDTDNCLNLDSGNIDGVKDDHESW